VAARLGRGRGRAAAALEQRGLIGQGPELAALGALAAGGGVGALLAAAGTEGANSAAVVIWTLAAGAAAVLTGGAAGPLVMVCLAPLASAAAFRSARLLPLGGAGAVIAGGLAGLASALLQLPTVSAGAQPWLAGLALALTTLGLGSAFVALYAEVQERDAERAHTETGLRELLDNQPQLLMSLYPGGRILQAFGEAPMGLALRDLEGRNLLELVAPDDRPQVESAIQRAAGGSAEATFTPANDPQGWFVLALRRLGPGQIVAALRDGRSQHARELDLDRARASAEAQNAGKSRFLANMSHELRTPLNAIMGFSDIMRQRLFGPIGDRYGEYVELIHDAGAHLLELINDILDMSKIEAERFELFREVFDAREVVSAVVRLMRGQAERSGVTLRGVLPAEPLEVEADLRALKQMALNLVSNAVKFTPRGGSVTIAVQAMDEVFELVVSDTGVGIAPKDLERLGQPFEQAGDADQRAAGSGLGLSLVRAFAGLHGGEMSLESALGEGTTVTVRLPVLAPPQAETSASATG
jgi:cell cycle sensor histidine kinase DivJ